VQPYALAGSLSRRQQSIELVVFLLLIVPSFVLSFAGTGPSNISFPLIALATIMQDVGLVALILLLIARANEPVLVIGWVRRGAWREAGLGLLLSIPVLIGAQLLESALHAAGLSSSSPSNSGVTPRGNVAELVLAAVLVVVVAIAEETIFRGYLLLRFGQALRSRGWAVVFSSIAFAIGHGYEGSAAVVTVGVTGLVFALVYIWRRSIVAPIVIHFVLDFLAIVLAPAGVV
jgi:CAAX protease family protein